MEETSKSMMENTMGSRWDLEAGSSYTSNILIFLILYFWEGAMPEFSYPNFKDLEPFRVPRDLIVINGSFFVFFCLWGC
jgi:hypothetical protein